MKRPFWSAQEALRQMECDLPTQPSSEQIRLDSMYFRFPEPAPLDHLSVASTNHTSFSIQAGHGDNDDIVQQPAECQEIIHNTEELRDRCGDDNVVLTEESNKDHKDHRQTIGQPSQAQVHLAADSFYDDWLHRGFQEPVRHMNHYMYGMYVRRRPVLEADLCS